MLFSGLLVHFFLAECIGGAPTLLPEHAQYVKSTRFPVALLPYPLVLDALAQLLAGLLVLLGLVIASGFYPAPAWLALPLVLLPLIPLGLGIGWWLGALSVYLRDLQQMVGVAVTAMLLLSPVLYPLDAVPQALRGLYLVNPLTLPVENLRELLFEGRLPAAWALLLPLALSVLFAGAGRWLFRRLQPGFYDVL